MRSQTAATRRVSYAVLLGAPADRLATTGPLGLTSDSMPIGWFASLKIRLQRAREIGVRMALGATRFRILTLLMGQGIRLTAVGIALGVLGAAAVTRYLETMLFGLTPLDPLTFIAVSLIVAAIAAFAVIVPARRTSIR